MEYIPGGDLMSMLIKEGTFSEERSRYRKLFLIICETYLNLLDLKKNCKDLATPVLISEV